MSWPVNIPKIVDGVSVFCAQDMNVIIQALEDRTTFLKQQIVNDSIIDGIGFSDIGLEDCTKGQFVAYNKTTQKYIPASPVWDNNNALPTDESYVLGVLISDVVDGQGLILVSGILRGKEIITAIMGNESHVPGNYYLNTNGSITQNLDNIAFPIHCGVLTATNCFVLGIQIPDFRTHSHTRYELNSMAWKPVKDAHITIPANATYFYDSTIDTTIYTVLRAFVSGTALVINNKCLLEYKDYIIQDGYIWLLKDFGTSIEGALYATNPFMGVVPWLNSMTVADGNNILKVQQVGTTAILNTSFNTIGTINNTGKAIAAISNNGITECTVVNDIEAGAGIETVKNDNGIIKINATSNLPKVLDFNIINGNGIVIGGNDIIMVKFPANRASSINGTVRIPSNVTGAQAQLFMYVEGIGSSTSPGTALVKAINIPIDQDEVVKPTTPIELSFNALSTPKTTSVYKWLTKESFDVTAGDQLNVTISFNNPANTVSVCSIGVYLKYN